MPTTTSSYLNSCPEAPNAVNILQVTLNVDGATMFDKVDRFSRPAGTVTADPAGAYKRMQLSYSPQSPDSLTLYKNGQAIFRPASYALVGRILVLTVEAAIDDDFYAVYRTAEQVAPGSSDIGVGTVVGNDYDGDLANVPAGFVACDGVTPLSKAAFATLYAWCTARTGYILSQTATTFILKSLTAPAYDGLTLVLVPAVIKY